MTGSGGGGGRFLRRGCGRVAGNRRGRGCEEKGEISGSSRTYGQEAVAGRGGVVLPQLPAGAEKRWGLQSPQSCRADGAPLGRFDVPGRTLAVCGSALAAGAVLPFDML